MTNVKITDAFREDLCMVESNRVLVDILNTVKLLAIIPSLGSTDVPESIQNAYGENVHKIPVNPFDIITYYDSEDNSVAILGLVHQRSAW